MSTKFIFLSLLLASCAMETAETEANPTTTSTVSHGGGTRDMTFDPQTCAVQYVNVNGFKFVVPQFCTNYNQETDHGDPPPDSVKNKVNNKINPQF